MTHQQGEGQTPQPQGYAQQMPPQQAHAQYQQVPYQQGYDQGVQYGQHPQYVQPGTLPVGEVPPGAQTTAGSEGNFLADVFEPTFTKSAVVKHAGWYYRFVVIVVLIGWIGKTVLDFVEGAADHAGYLMGGGGYEGPFVEATYNPWPGLYTFFVGGAIAFSLIILARLFLESTIARSKISERGPSKDD